MLQKYKCVWWREIRFIGIFICVFQLVRKCGILSFLLCQATRTEYSALDIFAQIFIILEDIPVKYMISKFSCYYFCKDALSRAFDFFLIPWWIHSFCKNNSGKMMGSGKTAFKDGGKCQLFSIMIQFYPNFSLKVRNMHCSWKYLHCADKVCGYILYLIKSGLVTLFFSIKFTTIHLSKRQYCILQKQCTYTWRWKRNINNLTLDAVKCFHFSVSIRGTWNVSSSIVTRPIHDWNHWTWQQAACPTVNYILVIRFLFTSYYYNGQNTWCSLSIF